LLSLRSPTGSGRADPHPASGDGSRVGRVGRLPGRRFADARRLPAPSSGSSARCRRGLRAGRARTAHRACPWPRTPSEPIPTSVQRPMSALPPASAVRLAGPTFREAPPQASGARASERSIGAAHALWLAETGCARIGASAGRRSAGRKDFRRGASGRRCGASDMRWCAGFVRVRDGLASARRRHIGESDAMESSPPPLTVALECVVTMVRRACVRVTTMSGPARRRLTHLPASSPEPSSAVRQHPDASVGADLPSRRCPAVAEAASPAMAAGRRREEARKP